MFRFLCAKADTHLKSSYICFWGYSNKNGQLNYIFSYILMVHYADTVARDDLIIVGTWSYNYNIPNKHKTFVYHLYNIGPTSSTLVQRCINAIQMFCVCWVKFTFKKNWDDQECIILCRHHAGCMVMVMFQIMERSTTYGWPSLAYMRTKVA